MASQLSSRAKGQQSTDKDTAAPISRGDDAHVAETKEPNHEALYLEDTLQPNVQSTPQATNDSCDTTMVPTTMSHFKIIDILGKGGIGAVYKAQDLELERFVAIKMIPQQQNEQRILLEEAKTISKLNHPNIVTIYDIAREADADFIVMEWINGKPLGNMIPPQGLPLDQVIDYAHQMVDAISCAHKQHIIHRDLKPQNIMIDGDNRVKILDFGISSLVQSAADKNINPQHRHTLSGTPHYMSPEQINGLTTDQRSDLFALGIVLYEMLTGAKPFLGINVEQIATAINQGDYAPLSEQLPSLDKDMITLVDKLMQSDPNARYQHAQALKKDLNVLSQKRHQQNHWWHRQHWLSKTLLILPIVVLIGWSMKEVLFPPTTQELIQRQLVDSKKIAFLPFDNISGDPVLQIFSDGVAAMLGNDLSEVGYHQGDGTIWVVPTNEINRLETPNVESIYNEYGVDLVVTGSVQHMGSTRSVILTLINGKDGRQLKSTQLTIDAQHLFAAQRDIRQEVVTMLEWRVPSSLTAQFSAQKPAFDGAYKHYLEGRGYLYRFDHSNNINKAINAFQQAISIDQTFADAYVGLAEAHLVNFLKSKNITHISLASNTVETLINIHPDHPRIAYLQGELQYNQGNYQQAVSLFKQTIEKQPQFLTAYIGLSNSYQELGQLTKAENVLLNAQKIMPNNNLILTNLGVLFYSQGNYAQALTYFEQLAKQAPNNFIAYLNISACYYLIGEVEQALSAAQNALNIEPNHLVYSNIGSLYFILRDFDNAVVAYEKMIALNDTDYINWGNLADAYRFSNNTKYIDSFNRAITLATKALTINPNNKEAIAMLAYYHANLEDSAKVSRYSNQISPQDGGEHLFFVAAAYARIGQHDDAIRYLEYAINNQYSKAEIVNSPLFQALDSEPAFNQLIINH